MSHYAKRNPENPHGLQGGHFPQPPSKYAGLTPEEVLDRMAQDNAQDQRFVEHGPAMLAMLARLREDYVMHTAPNAGYCLSCEVVALLAKVEGRTL